MSQEIIAKDGKERKNRVLLGALVFFLTLTFTLFYHNRFLSDTYSWNDFNAILLHRGEMPYRDYFVYYPPALLLKLEILWYAFGEKLLPIIMAGLIERAVIITLIYYILSKWFRPLYAFAASLLSLLIMMFSVFDTAGDYSWLSYTLGLMSAAFLVGYFEHTQKNSVYANFLAFAAFFFAAQGAMAKQSVGLAVAAAFILLFMIYIACRRMKGVWWSVAAALLGLTAGIAPWLIWLGANDALVPFFQQVYGAALNSKGLSSGGPAGSTLLNMVRSFFTWEYVLIGLLTALLLVFRGSKTEALRKRGAAACGVAAAAIVLIQIFRAIDLDTMGQFPVFRRPVLIVAMGIAFFLLCYSRMSGNSHGGEMDGCAFFAECFFLLWAVVSFFTEKQIARVLRDNQITAVETVISHACLFVLIVFCFRHVIVGWLNRGTAASDWSKFTYIVYSLANFMAIFLGGGDNNYAFPSYATAPFVLCVLLQWSEEHRFSFHMGKKPIAVNPEKLLLAAVVLVICVMSASDTAMRLQNAYNWWGVQVGTITDEDAYTVDYDMFDGFLVEKKTKTEFEQVGKLIEENSEEEDFVFIFPYSPIFRIMTNRYEMPTKTPVYFFDVCPDELAIADTEILKENPPKIIVWKDVGEACWKVHEQLFRGGRPCGQRVIQAWFEEVRERDYDFIGQIDNQYVYRLKDGTPAAYTFFATEEDLTSDINEVKGNLTCSDYARKLAELTASQTPLSRNGVYFAIFAGFALALMLGIAAGIPAWMFTAMLFGTMYFMLPCKPALLCGFAIPLIMLLGQRNGKTLKDWLWGLGIGGVALLSLTGWWDIWQNWAKDMAAVLLILLMTSFTVYALITLVSELKRGDSEWKRQTKLRLRNCTLVVAVTLTLLAAVVTVNSLADKREEQDFAVLQDIYDQVYQLRYQEEKYALLTEHGDALPALGADGHTISQINEALGQDVIDTDIRFGSKLLKKLSEDNVFVRISGEDVFVWIQEDTSIGNTGWAVETGERLYVISSLDP